MLAHSAITLGLIWAHLAQSASVPCDVKAFDKASGQVIFLAGGPTLPTTKEALDAYCSSVIESLRTANEYAENCIEGLAKGMMKLVLEGAGKEVTATCTEGDKLREEYLRVADCLIPKAGEAIHGCNKKVAALFEAAVSKPKKDRIPLSCCSMGEYYECIRAASSACGKDAEAFTKEIVDAYAGDLMDSVCATWGPGSAKCKGLPKLKPVAKPVHLTLAPPLAEVLASLSN